MNATTIGTYEIPGGTTITLRVPDPDDLVTIAKINAISERMEETQDAEMNIRYFAILIGVLSGRSTEEIMTMVPLPTITQMVLDFRTWVSCLQMVRPC